ncbi:MAG: hypothetical protein A2Y63_00015 [Candidatus Riflebacteria bacterium RBG_13_59_9]|nr:MAG: hypothetical protein A2Y63_00015 [Candidatus Riflebacteria bacterium RBG_13_59_9]
MEEIRTELKFELKPRIAWSWGGLVFNWLYPMLAGNPIWILLLLLLYFILYYPAFYVRYDDNRYIILWLILCPVYAVVSLLMAIFGRNLAWLRRRRIRLDTFESDQRIIDLVGMYFVVTVLTIITLAFVIGSFTDALWSMSYPGGT